MKRWHKNLLLSELLATAVVIGGYRAAVVAKTGRSLGERFAAGLWTILLAPGWWLLGKPGEEMLAIVCLLNALLYTVVIFGILSLMTLVLRRLKAVVSIEGAHPRDLTRYLR